MSKKLYEQPTTKVLVVRVEGALLTGSPNAVRLNSASSGYEELYDLGEI